MTKHSVISARIDPETLELVDRIVAEQGRSRAWFIAQAVRHAAEQEARFAAFLQEGRDDIAAGRVVDHAEALKMMDDMIAGHEARCTE
ncbi:CopG family transcriptional regulator [Sphingopyxis lindanitolerans]|uniref:CopG family transcriptional regulator n=1 Tax=Sphingopyxis lindanitolerans TaxID=2054227 RepID=A0A2S8B7J0_9SPHN|nr:ribbon-helix-helix protein, CopG family [Sphingopyxis lindanitolerans]PQM28283.1 CopG family transcriptional regulator [Sphingopyxis lindanitolerans]